MIVGESHYYDPNEGEGSLKKHQDKRYTRIAVEKIAMGREYRTYRSRRARIFPNLHYTLFGNDRLDTKLLWENVAYYNFIQEPMNTNKGRPRKADYKKGWLAFAEAISTLKPSTCLFLGTSSAHFLPQSFGMGIEVIQPLSDDGWLNKTASRKITLQLPSNQQVLVKFIRHPSNHYSWGDWNKNLKTKCPELMQRFSQLTNRQ